MPMEDSILKGTKQLVGLMPEDDAFDFDILIQINAALGVLDQLGIEYIPVEDNTPTWTQMSLPPQFLSLIRSFVGLKVQMAWDPPVTPVIASAKKDQLAELEWRISNYREMETMP